MLGNINEMITLVIILFTNAIVICIVTGVKERAHGGVIFGILCVANVLIACHRMIMNSSAGQGCCSRFKSIHIPLLRINA
ncbi:hypothetical protein, partial [Providencia stuartii]